MPMTKKEFDEEMNRCESPSIDKNKYKYRIEKRIENKLDLILDWIREQLED